MKIEGGTYGWIYNLAGQNVHLYKPIFSLTYMYINTNKQAITFMTSPISNSNL